MRAVAAPKELREHDCRTAQQMQWNRIKNGELLSLAEPQFDLFLTCDQNLQYQQNLMGRSITILELSANKLRRLVAATQLIRTRSRPCAQESFGGSTFRKNEIRKIRG